MSPGRDDERSLDAKVAAIEAEVAGVKADVAGIRTAMERLAEEGRPKRESVTAWISVVVALAGLLLYGFVREIDRVARESKEERIALDVRLQREMRDLDGTMIERINGLRERVDRNTERTEHVWQVMLEQLPRSVEDRGRLAERIDALRDRMNALEVRP